MATVYIRQDLYIRVIKAGLEPSAYINEVLSKALESKIPVSVKDDETQTKLTATKPKTKKVDS